MTIKKNSCYVIYSLDGEKQERSDELLEERFGRNYRNLFDRVPGGYGSIVHTITINKKFYHIKRERKNKINK
jgi:hypothetical protein